MHTVTISNPIPLVPEIEFLKLAQREQDAVIDDSLYRQYIAMLKDSPQHHNSSEIAKTTAEYPHTDKCEYLYSMGLPFGYTYRQTLYLSYGVTYTFETKKNPVCGSDPVMYLFKRELEPESSTSWVNNDKNGTTCQSYISQYIGAGQYGTYILMVRANVSSSPGTSDMWMQGYLASSDIIVGGKAMYANTGTMDGNYTHTTGDLNYFCCPVNDDAESNSLFLSTGAYDPIKAYNHGGYSGSGSFPSTHTRIKLSSVSNCLDYAILATHSTDDTGVCDLYIGLKNFSTSITGLDPDDAIQADSDNISYNCHAWAGGISGSAGFFHPNTYPGAWFVSGQFEGDLESFDLYYGNSPKRYTGAYDYTRNNANSSNGIAALWGYSSIGGFEHSSVKNPGNNHPHGYAWESKYGLNERFMHPRDDLASEYGSIQYYYRWDGTTASKTTEGMSTDQYMTMEQSIALGLTILDEEQVSTNDRMFLEKLCENIPEDKLLYINNGLDALNNMMKTEFRSASSYKPLQETKDYLSFVSFVEDNKTLILPLLFNKYIDGVDIVAPIIVDVTFDEFLVLGKSIITASREEKYTDEGAYIAPNYRANMHRYIIGILHSEHYNWDFENKDEPTKQLHSIPKSLELSPIHPIRSIQQQPFLMVYPKH